MARVNIINLNLVQLPKTACLNPSPSFYAQFNGACCVSCCVPHVLSNSAARAATGYTLGLAFAVLGMCLLHQFGVKLVSRLSLRGMSEEERAARVSKFSSTVLSRALLVLYIVYPGAR